VLKAVIFDIDGLIFDTKTPFHFGESIRARIIKKMDMVQLAVSELDGDIDLEFYQRQPQRQQQIIKSWLYLLSFHSH